MNTEFTMYQNALVVKLVGELDQYAAASVKGRIDIELESAGRRNLIFDLSGATFMDSSGIGLIIGRYKKLKAIGGSVAVTGALGAVNRVIELSGLSGIVSLTDSLDQALALYEQDGDERKGL